MGTSNEDRLASNEGGAHAARSAHRAAPRARPDVRVIPQPPKSPDGLELHDLGPGEVACRDAPRVIVTWRKPKHHGPVI